MTPTSPDRDRPDEDVDAAFARIIAGWDDVPTVDHSPSLTQPGDPPGPEAATAPAAAAPPLPPRPPQPLTGPSEPGPRDSTLAPEPDEGFVPAEPPPLPRGDVPGVLAWAAVLLGPLFLLFAGLFWRSASPLWLGLAVLAFIGGFAALVMRLPPHRDADSDDGAVL